MAHIIAIANQKGGVGKTTLTYNIAAALSRLEKRVLLVDNDPQGNLTTYSGQEIPETQLTLDEIYLRKDPAPLQKHQTLRLKENLHLIPSDTMLAGVEYYLISKSQKDQILSRHLSALKEHFDFILIDNPPSLNLLTLNGLLAAESILVPVQPEFFSLEGISQLHATIEDLKRWKPSLRVLGFVANLFDGRRKLNLDVLRSLAEAYPNRIFETRIRNSVKIAESAGFGRSIFEYSPKSKSSEEFLSLAHEVLRRVEV